MRYAKVIVDISHSSVDRLFDYAVPEKMSVCAGQRVKVSFGRQSADGIVLGFSDVSDIDADKIKPIEEALDGFAVINGEQLALSYYIKEKYNTTLARALRLMYPSVVRHDKGKIKTRGVIFLCRERLDEAMASVTAKNGEIKYPAQKEIIDSLCENDGQGAGEFAASPLKTLIKKGFVEKKDIQVERRAFSQSVEQIEDFELTGEQSAAVNCILKNKGGRFLLHGVTGSGKTEVYIRVIRDALSRGKTAIMLVPEISLTPQTYRFLKQRFSCGIAVFHSGLSDGERFDEWNRVRRGEAKIVLGARSAVFAPLEDLGVIIIDEEHESSYKADNYPKYTAQEIAEERCIKNGATLILGSATPAINTYYDAKNGKYTLLTLKKRIFGQELPRAFIVDMRSELQKGNKTAISALLYEKMKRALAEKKQIMLFLNRRGYNTFVMCRSCGYVVKCDACDVSMTYHKAQGVLKCHYCGRVKTPTNICPECGKPHLRYFGAGTQQVEEQIKNLFPAVRTLRMDLDTMGEKDAHLKVYSAFSRGEADVLVGTQMITKGFDFANVELSAVIAADTMLNIPDYRSAERTFMHITQIAGRAGRKQGGEVVLQTYSPDNYAVLHASRHDYEGFYSEEINLRRFGKLPPFTTLVTIQFSGKKEENVVAAVKDFLKKIRISQSDGNHDIISIRAAESAVKRINEMSRYNIYINAVKREQSAFLDGLYSVFNSAAYDGVLVGIDKE